MKKFSTYITCFIVTLAIGAGSAVAQQGNPSPLEAFIEGVVQELGAEATRQILRSMFGSDTEARNAVEQPERSFRCQVTDPTGTPLNVRSTPNGPKIITTLSNGRRVTPYKVAYDEKNRHWILVGDDIRPLGWVFGPYVSCFLN